MSSSEKPAAPRPSWRAASNQQPPPDLFDEEPATAPKSAVGLTVTLRSLKFIDKESGFFIATGVSETTPNDIPLHWRGRWNPSQVTIKGTAPDLADMSSVGIVLECAGTWVMDPKFGLQYQFDWAREALPSSVEALLKYLSSARLKGIGPAIAKLIVDKWGAGTFAVLEGDPTVLTEIPGITPEKAAQIQKDWQAKKDTYQLSAFFGMYGIGAVWLPRIMATLGDNALEARIRANPYLLIAVDGIGFATADRMALSLGIDRDSPKRKTAMLEHLLNEFTTKQGHTARPVEDWLREAASQLGVAPADLHAIAQAMVDAKSVVLRTLPVSRAELTGNDRLPLEAVPTMCVSPRRDYLNERTIAEDIKRLAQNATMLGAEQTVILNTALAGLVDRLDPSQLEGVQTVLSSPVSILTGGPGTGKTTTLKNVIDIAEAMGWEVVLAAPTGRAAKRMRETIGRPSGTLHRVLGFKPGAGFSKNRNSPLLGQLFVIDEASMLDNALAAAWLRALPPGARVIFVGDVDQLPSVGAGNFLKDLMASGAANTARLTRVHRQAEGSLIATAAQRILRGHLPQVGGDPWQDDFTWITPPNGLSSFEVNEFIQAKVVELAAGYVERGVQRSDIQVISPQRDGLTGVAMLNDSLRHVLNTKGVPAGRSDEPFLPGDRCLVTKNDYDKNIFNGDMGIVHSVDEDGIIDLTMEDGERVSIEPTLRKALTPGYAITVHKSQGGERPVIIMPCSPSHTFSMNRNLLYTGITRGRNRVVIIGQPKTLQSVLSRQEKMYRLTGMAAEIENTRKPAPAKPSKP